MPMLGSWVLSWIQSLCGGPASQSSMLDLGQPPTAPAPDPDDETVDGLTPCSNAIGWLLFLIDEAFMRYVPGANVSRRFPSSVKYFRRKGVRVELQDSDYVNHFFGQIFSRKYPGIIKTSSCLPLFQLLASFSFVCFITVSTVVCSLIPLVFPLPSVPTYSLLSLLASLISSPSHPHRAFPHHSPPGPCLSPPTSTPRLPSAPSPLGPPAPPPRSRKGVWTQPTMIIKAGRPRSPSHPTREGSQLDGKLPLERYTGGQPLRSVASGVGLLVWLNVWDRVILLRWMFWGFWYRCFFFMVKP